MKRGKTQYLETLVSVDIVWISKHVCVKVQAINPHSNPDAFIYAQEGLDTVSAVIGSMRPSMHRKV